LRKGRGKETYSTEGGEGEGKTKCGAKKWVTPSTMKVNETLKSEEKFVRPRRGDKKGWFQGRDGEGQTVFSAKKKKSGLLELDLFCEP